MNITMIVGTICSAVECRDVRDDKLTRFRVKTPEALRSDGSMRDRSQTIIVEVWNAYLQKEVTQFLREGQMVAIVGQNQNRKVPAANGKPEYWINTLVLRYGGSITVYAGPGSNNSVHADANDEPGNVPKVDHRPDSERRAPAPVDHLQDTPF